MFRTRHLLTPALVVAMSWATLQGAAESTQAADAFARKMTLISEHGSLAAARGSAAALPRRTPVSETEVNSWFAYRAQPMLPEGLSQPKLTIIGGGRVMGGATVDLEAIGKRKSSGGGALDVWSYLGGRVPITVTGVLHTEAGRGRFEIQAADVSGIPLPRTLLQEVVSYYSRTPEHPEGIRLDEAFALPANIQKIEVGSGQAVVVQ
jgi:hypothetical protein